MSSRRLLLLAASMAVVLLLALAGPIAGTRAQTATPPAAPQATAPATGAAAAGTSPAVATTPGTPTPTRTPTITPSPTATLTSLQARLVLAQTYLEGKDFERAAELFAEIFEEDRGNVQARDGLAQALAGRAAIEATIMAPPPTETPAPAPTAATFRSSFLENLRDIGGTALAAVAVLIVLYFLAHLLRWLLGALRELWYLRILPLIRRPAVPPGYLIGAFESTLGPAGEAAARIVPQAISEKLIAWNQLVADKQIPVEPAPDLQLGAMAWISVLWRWLLPPPRGYRLDGLLTRGPANTYQLTVRRAALATNSIDRSRTFSAAHAVAEDAYANMAAEAAKWLISPMDIEASTPVPRTMRESVGSPPEASVPNASAVFDRALELLLPVRQQVNEGSVDFPAARQRLAEAQVVIQELPSASPLREDLEHVIADLRKVVPG